jgi:hypothetical protein
MYYRMRTTYRALYDEASFFRIENQNSQRSTIISLFSVFFAYFSTVFSLFSLKFLRICPNFAEIFSPQACFKTEVVGRPL